MRLKRARVQKYRSIIDSGEFDIEEMKTILVGPNEAGKSALLQALQLVLHPAKTGGGDVVSRPGGKPDGLFRQLVRIVVGFLDEGFAHDDLMLAQ